MQQAVQPASIAQEHLFRPLSSSPEWVEVDIHGVRVERSRQFGGCWLGLALVRRLGLSALLEELLPQGREGISWSVMVQILVLGRMVEASSELRLAELTYEASALAELLGVPAEKVKREIVCIGAWIAYCRTRRPWRSIFSSAWASCFSSTTTCCSMTSPALTALEGEAAANPQAQRGYSRDHRPDCKQVNIALVVSRSGLPSWLRSVRRQPQ